MRACAIVCALSALVSITPVARSQERDTAEAPQNPHAAQPERPTVSTPATTVAPGWVELETGVESDRRAGAHTLLTPSVLKFGVVPRVQFDVLGSFQHLSGTLPNYSGIGDIGVALKWRALEHTPVLGDFALQPMLKFPTGSAAHGAGTGTTDVGLLLISSHSWGKYALDINAEYTRRSGDGSRAPRDATLWTVSGSGPVYASLAWVVELFGYPRTTGPAGQDGIVALLAGPTVEVEKYLIIDAGAIVPLAGPQPHAFYAGLTWNIGKL